MLGVICILKLNVTLKSTIAMPQLYCIFNFHGIKKEGKYNFSSVLKNKWVTNLSKKGTNIVKEKSPLLSNN